MNRDKRPFLGWLLSREDGVLLGTFLGTVASVVLSLLLTAIGLAIFGDLYKSLPVGLPVAILISAVIAPLFFWVSLNLMSEIYRARAQLEQLSLLDQTEAYTRHHFLELAAREVDNARRYRYPMSLVAVEVDRFRDIVNGYGYKEGDEVLKRVAEVCLGTGRKGDLVGRLGDAGFLILLPHTIGENGMVFAERLRVNIRNLLVDLGPTQIGTTISLGVAGAGSEEADLDRLLVQAGRAVREAKAAGGNRSVLAE